MDATLPTGVVLVDNCSQCVENPCIWLYPTSVDNRDATKFPQSANFFFSRPPDPRIYRASQSGM